MQLRLVSRGALSDRCRCVANGRQTRTLCLPTHEMYPPSDPALLNTLAVREQGLADKRNRMALAALMAMTMSQVIMRLFFLDFFFKMNPPARKTTWPCGCGWFREKAERDDSYGWFGWCTQGKIWVDGKSEAYMMIPALEMVTHVIRSDYSEQMIAPHA